ncbi:Putative Mitochondrial import inner membrane translocase subunit tim44 [[Torrubiella] hemipterigena]|uniref:Mitochondrial import inner membrane translocase subunit TIM44 n=1 Tax=[Torrubiella] hemipterigena TaxID=1531966 RepID=A0A0A1T9W1_9HYPO|nr:Putative Mitochondrial import inner membrane translocase subunit tim44 [[Torrubiella] hemipterigena]
MSSLVRGAAVSQGSIRLAHSYGANPAYRRLASQLATAGLRTRTQSASPTISSTLTSQFLPSDVQRTMARGLSARFLHTTGRALQDQAKPKEEAPKKDGAAAAAEGEAEQKKPEEEGEKKTEEDGEKKSEEGEGKDGEKKEKKDDLPPPPPHGDKTPWQVFMETMNTEFQASKEWNESTKQIGAAATEFSESESVKRAREVYEKSTGAVSSVAGAAVKSTAGAIGKGAAWTWDTEVVKGVRKAANATGDALDTATKPLRETEAYKNVKNVIDDGSSSRYGGWTDKAERRKKREAMDKARGGAQVFQEDPEAGTGVTLHKDAAWKEAWRDFRDSNKFVQGVFSMKGRYEESENPLISTARSITDRIGGFFAENETAQVIKRFRSMDPAFQVEPFLQELREYMLPEVLDAYVKGDTETLKLWLSAAQFSVYEALTKQYLQAGMKSDGRILDIRNVDILRARILDPGEVPVFIITCRTQEVHVYRNAKSGELAAGMEDKVQLVTYAIGITRVPEDVNNPETRGWRLIEMQKSGRDWY